MNKINTSPREMTIVQADIFSSYTDFDEVMAWTSNSFGPNGLIAGSCTRWAYLSGGNFGFLFEEDAVLFSLRWS
jgi:hypothetical protein